MDTTETPIYYAMIGCGLLIVIFTLIHIFSSMWLHEKFEVKRQQRIKAELDSREAERSRISRDIHDGIGPMIYRIRRKVEDARDKEFADKRLLNDGLNTLTELHTQLIATSKGLAPANLELRGLVYCIEELAMEVMMDYPVVIKINSRDLPPIASDKSIHIYRIVEEIIWNTVKYSKGDILLIELVYEHHLLFMRASDNSNGAGKNDQIFRDGSGQGLGNIYTRTKILDGSVAMDCCNGWKWEFQWKVL